MTRLVAGSASVKGERQHLVCTFRRGLFGLAEPGFDLRCGQWSVEHVDLVDQSGKGQRALVTADCPLIVSADRYHQSRRETILVAITSNVGRRLAGDYQIKAWRESGLLHPSTATGIVRTIKQEMIAAKLGELPAAELHAVDDRLREILAL